MHLISLIDITVKTILSQSTYVTIGICRKNTLSRTDVSNLHINMFVTCFYTIFMHSWSAGVFFSYLQFSRLCTRSFIKTVVQTCDSPVQCLWFFTCGTSNQKWHHCYRSKKKKSNPLKVDFSTLVVGFIYTLVGEQCCCDLAVK